MTRMKELDAMKKGNIEDEFEAELEAERVAARERTKRRAEFIQKQIDEKGLAQFLAEMRINGLDGRIFYW